MKYWIVNKLKKLHKPNFWLILPFGLLSLFLVIIPLIIIIFYAFKPAHVDGQILSTDQNFAVLDSDTLVALGRSLWVAIVATIITLIIAYPFSYFLSFANSKTFKVIILVIVTAPIWSSFLIKLIGLKSLLDILNGGSNTTFGIGYTLLGLIYLYLPFAIIPIYTVLDQMPKNLINASNDLGCNSWETFFKVVLPYTKAGMMSAIILVFLPSFTTVAVGQFLDNANNSALIGDINYEQGILGLESPLALARSSALSLIISIIMFFVYGLIVLVPKIYAIFKLGNIKLGFETEFKFVAKILRFFKTKVFKRGAKNV